jgi:hypothetical protein
MDFPVNDLAIKYLSIFRKIRVGRWRTKLAAHPRILLFSEPIHVSVDATQHRPPRK